MSTSTYPQGSSYGAGGELDAMRRSQVGEAIVSGQAQIVRQQEQLRNLSQENDQIKKQISSVAGTHYDYVKADKLASLQGEVDALERRYQFEKMKKNDLTKRYQLARIDLLHSRKMKGGVYVEKEQSEAVQRQVDILENRLDQALGKFNDALSYNKELREQIDIIREERRVFQRVHKKMEDDLNTRRKIMAERIEQSNKDMDERDEYLRQAAQLEMQIAKQQEEQAERLRELDGAMMEVKTMREDQMNLQLELEAREFEFEEQLDAIRAEQAAGHNGTNASNPLGTNTAGTGTRGAGPFGDSVHEEEEDDVHPASNVLRVENEPSTITDIIAQINEATHTANLEGVCQDYSRLGDANFSLYKYINELTASREALNDEIRDLRTLLQEETTCEGDQRRLIKELEEKLAVTEGKLEKMRGNIGQLNEAVSLACNATEEVFTNIGCAGSEQSEAPKDDHCTEANLLLFLGSIEERALHILCAYQRHQRVGVRKLELAQQKHSHQHSIDDDEENALTANTTDSPRGEMPPTLFADELDGLEIAPLLPIAPQTGPNSVSAKRLVRQTELPSASLATGDNAGHMHELEDDQVVSHDALRKKMEMRLISRREREERAQQRRRKEGGAAVSPRKGR